MSNAYLDWLRDNKQEMEKHSLLIETIVNIFMEEYTIFDTMSREEAIEYIKEELVHTGIW